MDYTVALTTPGRGLYLTLGYVTAPDAQKAQTEAAKWLESVGIAKHEISHQVSDYTTLRFRGSELTGLPCQPLTDIASLLDLFRTR